MARNGVRIIDVDTHVLEPAAVAVPEDQLAIPLVELRPRRLVLRVAHTQQQRWRGGLPGPGAPPVVPRVSTGGAFYGSSSSGPPGRANER